MSPEAPPSTTVVTQMRKLLGLSGDEGEVGALSLESLLQRTRRQLLDCARYVNLTGIQQLAKGAIAERLLEFLLGGVDMPSRRPLGRRCRAGAAAGDRRRWNHRPRARIRRRPRRPAPAS